MKLRGSPTDVTRRQKPEYFRQRRILKGDEIRAKDRARNNTPERREYARLSQKRRYANPEKRAQLREYQRKWHRENYVRRRTEIGYVRRSRIKNNGAYERFARKEIFERDRWVCQLCFAPVDSTLRGLHPMAPTLDHIIPVSKGGQHTRANSQLAHWTCNQHKWAKLPGEMA